MQNKPWRNEVLKKCEEALPRLKEGGPRPGEIRASQPSSNLGLGAFQLPKEDLAGAVRLL